MRIVIRVNGCEISRSAWRASSLALGLSRGMVSSSSLRTLRGHRPAPRTRQIDSYFSCVAQYASSADSGLCPLKRAYLKHPDSRWTRTDLTCRACYLVRSAASLNPNHRHTSFAIAKKSQSPAPPHPFRRHCFLCSKIDSSRGEGRRKNCQNGCLYYLS